MLVDLDQDTPRTYVARGNPKLELFATLGGGIVFLLAIAFMLVALFLSPKTSASTQPGLIGGLSVIPIMLISRGLFAMRNINRVTLDPNGIAVESPLSFKLIPWTQIQRMAKKDRRAFMGQSHETLMLIGADGKELAQIRDTIDRFPELVQQIEYRLAAARGTPVVAEEEAPLEMKRARRRGIIMGSFFALFTLGMIAGTAASLNEWIHEKKYATEAVTTDAKILKHYMVRQTHYVEFEFTDPAGQTHQRAAMVEMVPWEQLTHAKTVPVQYLRSDPSWNRLATGEDRVTFDNFWPLGIIGMVMFGTGAVFSFLGFDLNNKGGTFQLTRWGKPLRRTSASQ